MIEKDLIKVTCAIIEKGAKVLAVQRSQTMPLPGKWEFPGGKVESNESLEECILREILEELNCEIEILEALSPNPHSPILLIPYRCQLISGEIQLREHAQMLWCDKEALASLDWAEADIAIVQEYLALNRL